MKKRKVYDGKVLSLNIYDLMVKGRKVKREIVEHGGAAATLAFEDDKVILVKQHRFPHRAYLLEIPAGTIERGEDPKKCAFRELQEETGFTAKKMIHLISYYPSVGYNTEIIHCYVASGLKKSSDLNLDEDEIMSVVKINFKKLLNMILAGKIIDSKTICAVLVYAIKKKLV